MPKQILEINPFHGGLNNNADPRDIKVEELSQAQDIMVDEIGKVRTMGSHVAHDAGTNSVDINPGYGLFHFSQDRLKGETAGTAAAETGDDYLVMADTDSAADLDIYSRVEDSWGTSKIDLGSASGMKPCFYAVDGALRVSDGEFTNANDNKWYGYIKRTHFNGLTPDGTADAYDGWYSKNQEIAAPTKGLFGQFIFSETNNSGNTTTNLQASNGDAFSGMDTALDVGDYIMVNTDESEACVVTARVDDRNLTHVAGTASTNTDDYIIFPPAGKGFNVDVGSRSGQGGSWAANDYEIATTFIYHGNQESLLYENVGNGDLFAVSANDVIDWTIHCTSPFDPMISGGRVYIRQYDTEDPWSLLADISLRDGVRSGLGDTYIAWELISATGTTGAANNVYLQGGFEGVYDGGTQKGTTRHQNAETYESLNGISQTENTLTAKFKTAVVANRMVYVGNVRMKDDDNETVTMGDAIIKSPVNKFDTFSLSRIIEATVRDGDEIIKLEEYADRILQFKKNKMQLINISQEIEFLEDTFMHKGVSVPSATCKTDYGVAWVNENGCYLYDGQRVNDLLEKGGVQIIKESDWSSFIGDTPMIGYIPKKRQIIVATSAGTGANNGNIYLYDIVTKSWVQGDSKLTDNKHQTNFITDWNGDLVHAHSSGTVVKWDDTSASTSNLLFATKDMTFGQPGQRKKLHKVYITYKGDASSLVVKYAIDGETDSTDFRQFNSTDTPLADKSSSENLEQWHLAELTPTTSSQANNLYSSKFHLSGSVGSSFEINDINVVFRMKNIK